MLNSGFQALYLKQIKPQVFSKVKKVLHFPQYLSFLLTGKTTSEHTSIGCHTALWDFDNMGYHSWTKNLGDTLPVPLPVETAYPSVVFDSTVQVGIGIHDSSSSLVPYFNSTEEEFILISTGTWCISMNPFNEEALTAEELNKDCLAFLSIRQKPVKSSRFFMGRIHDENVKRLSGLFGENDSAYKTVCLDEEIIRALRLKSGGAPVFFKNGVPDSYVDRSVKKESFSNFSEAYHQLLMDLVQLVKESIDLVFSSTDHARNIYISGGFSKNQIFLKLIASHYPAKAVYASEVSNASSLGAALVLWKGIDPGVYPTVDLNLKAVKGEPSLVD
jgi:sugar (pentulose or hexulose) kinase